MKRRKWFLSMCFLLSLILCGCGKSTSDAEKTDASGESVPEVTAETSIPKGGTAEETVEQVEEQVPMEMEYAMAVIVTINPQVKLYLDSDNIIIGVEYLNEDAKTAFSDIDFSHATVEEGMEKIIEAAVEKEFLTDGKDVSIDVAEVKDTACDSTAVCAQVEAAAIRAVEDNHVAALVTAQVSAEPEKTETVTQEPIGGQGQVSDKESVKPAEEETVAETVAEAVPETKEEQPAEEAEESVAESVPSNPCSNCGGSGKCDECKGDGYRGAGYTVSCPRCHGSLTETCIYCDANGNSTKHDGACDFPNCMGAHVYPCTTCGGGSRPVTCASCNGSGKCKVCHGSGTK
ncbi:MAG: hypothetical protein ACI4EQ_08310 [Lachnospiraceae bacterium]